MKTMDIDMYFYFVIFIACIQWLIGEYAMILLEKESKLMLPIEFELL